jgi:hypothetical protein
MRVEETGMRYIDFLMTINPFVLGILVLVIACGVYDHWMQPK